jgi:hypothetical protein
MATSATIILKTKEAKYKSIYLHNDGYPKGAGYILKKYYKDYDKVEKLISLGNISSLGLEPISTPQAWKKRDDMFYVMEHPEFWNKYTFAYKDRGDTGQEAQESQELAYAIGGTDYSYLYQDGKWYMVDDNAQLKSF